MDVSQATFETDVIERSRTVPVVVDFWAAWCAPCRMLGPVLEREVERRSGTVELAKLDVDANPELANRYGIQGIPAVKAFKDGKVVAEFVGAQPPPAVSRFLDGLVPSQAELLAKKGDEASLREAVKLEPGNAGAALRLARLLVARGELAGALDVLEPIRGSFAADGLAARIRLQQAPQDGYTPAFTALDAGDRSRALDLLIGAIRPGRSDRDDLRRVVVGILEELGPDDPLTAESRRKLASALY